MTLGWLAILWIVGDGYVAKLQEGKLETFASTARSSGFDPSACRVWTAEEATRELVRYDAGGSHVEGRGVSAILSDVSARGFFTRSADGALVQRRAADGTVSEEAAVPWSTHAVAVASAGDRLFSLNYLSREVKLWVSWLGEGLQEQKQTQVPFGDSMWTNPRAVGTADGGLWLGLTTSGPKRPASPRVERRGPDGSLLASHDWKERGFFFDLCADGDGVLVARDVPSNSGFTVPLNAYLERVDASGNAEKVYSAETNRVIDAIACTPQAVYLAERGLLGADGKRVVAWNREPGAEPTVLATLPAAARRLYACRP